MLLDRPSELTNLPASLQNGNAGACGKVNPDSARVIALYTSAYANGANCGRTVEIQNLDDGTSTTATVAGT